MVNKKWAIAVAIVVAAAMVGAVLSASDWTASANPGSSSDPSDNMNKGSTSQDSVHSAGNVSAGAMAEYANNAVTDYCQPSAYDVALASSINATVSYQYTPGTYYYAGGIFMQNDTWYPMIVNEKVVGTACSGQVWDIVCLGNGNVSGLTMEMQNANGTWSVVTPIVIHGCSYCVIDSWNTSDVYHIIHLRFMYTGNQIGYRGDLITLTSNGDMAGYQLWWPVTYVGGLFNANVIQVN